MKTRSTNKNGRGVPTALELAGLQARFSIKPWHKEGSSEVKLKQSIVRAAKDSLRSMVRA